MARVTYNSAYEVSFQMSEHEARLLHNFMMLNLPAEDNKSTPARLKDQLQDILEAITAVQK